MARPLLIIEFSGSSVRAALFPSGASKAPSYISLPSGRSVREDAGAALDAVKKQTGADPAACSVFVGLPPSSVSMRAVSVPVDRREKINEILPFELAGSLSAETGEFVMDNIPLGNGKAIAVAVDKKTLAGYLEAFASLGVDPVWAGVTGFSIPRLLYELYPAKGTQAFVSDDFISVSTGGKPLFFNSYSGLTGLRLNLSYLDAESIKIDEAYHTAEDTAIEKLLPGVPATGITLAGGLPPEAAGMAALALDVRQGVTANTVNLRKGEFEYTREKAAAGRKLRLSAVLALVIAAILLGDAYLRYAALDNTLDAYRASLRQEYTKIFPNEKVPVDELYQLMAKLKEIESETAIVKGGAKVLEVMEGLAKAAGKEGALSIRLNELTIADGKIKATGEAASFDAANRFKTLLSEDGLFKSVQISDLKSKGAGAAFSLIISI